MATEFKKNLRVLVLSPEKMKRKLLQYWPYTCPSNRALLLTSYVKFVNLFPEIKPHVQQIFSLDSNLR